jgi:carbon starvation protein
VAIFVGLMVYKWHFNQILASVIGIILLLGLIVLGYFFPISLGEGAIKTWIVILLAYAFLASVLPVNILLQPRDYLSCLVLFLALLGGYIGLLITRPTIQTPVFLGWKSIKGSLWPMMLVIIACGAISGFHSLIASGTTSKQLAQEKEAKRIGYGGMILEGVLAVLALLSVTAGLYWLGAKQKGLIYPELMKEKGWIGAFGLGYGRLVKPIFGPLSGLVGITMLKTFVMTTLDSATRITRYLGEEFLGESLKLKWFKNRFFSTGAIIILSGYLSFGNWKAIWPIFGASNQLVAALALMVITTYLFIRKKMTKFTLYPAIFMLLTALGSLIFQLRQFLSQGKYLLGSIAVVLIGLTIFMVKESWGVIKKTLKGS